MGLSERIDEAVQAQREYASGVMNCVSKSTQDAIIQEMAKFRGMRDSAIELEGERNRLITENAALKAALKARSRKYKWLPYTGNITSFLAGTYGFVDAEGINYYGTVITKDGCCIVTLAWTDNKGEPRCSQWRNRHSMYGELPNFVKYRMMHKWIDPAIEKERKWKEMEKLITSAELTANNQATTIPPPEPLPQNDDGHVVVKPVFIKMVRDWPIANIEDSVDVTLTERDVSLKTVGKATIEKTVGGYLARIKIMDKWVGFIKNRAILYPYLIGQISDATFHFTSIHLGAVPLRKDDERLELPE